MSRFENGPIERSDHKDRFGWMKSKAAQVVAGSAVVAAVNGVGGVALYGGYETVKDANEVKLDALERGDSDAYGEAAADQYGVILAELFLVFPLVGGVDIAATQVILDSRKKQRESISSVEVTAQG